MFLTSWEQFLKTCFIVSLVTLLRCLREIPDLRGEHKGQEGNHLLQLFSFRNSEDTSVLIPKPKLGTGKYKWSSPSRSWPVGEGSAADPRSTSPRSPAGRRNRSGDGVRGHADLKDSKPHFQIQPFCWKHALLSHVSLVTYRITAWSSFWSYNFGLWLL